MGEALTFETIEVFFPIPMGPVVEEILPSTVRRAFAETLRARSAPPATQSEQGRLRIPQLFGEWQRTRYFLAIEGSHAQLHIRPGKPFSLAEVRQFQIMHNLGEDPHGPGMMPTGCSNLEVQRRIVKNVREARLPWAYGLAI